MQMERLQDGLEAAAASEKWCPEIKNEVGMDIRSLQKPLKERYRNNSNASRITLRAKGGQTDVPVACSVDIGRAIYQAEAHKGVGGGGTGACSGDLLLGSLAACAQITCQMVAASMGIPIERIEVTVDGDLDLRPSALKAFTFILTLLRLRQHRNSYADCERKQNSIAW